MVTIVQGSTRKTVSAQRLVQFFSSRPEFDGFLYIGYPIVGTADGPYPIDALYISKSTGLVVFTLVEGKVVDDINECLDDSHNKIEAKLRSHKKLMAGRTLLVEINPVAFVPMRSDVRALSTPNYPICNESSLQEWLDNLEWGNPEAYEPLLEVVQAVSSIRAGRRSRSVRQEDSRGSRLKRLEESIANLDSIQGRAVIETVDGVQRIRGLAGSGKTIVLALKAAYLHAQHPEWKIAITFQTRSLKGLFKQLINTFVIEQTSAEPNWENLQILQSWGAPGGGERNGIYYEFCHTNEVDYYDFGSAKIKFGPRREFEGACSKALRDCKTARGIYDLILVDEAQDFPSEFLKLCYRLLKKPKRLVYAYDELQNLGSQSLPSPEEIFGKKRDGKPLVTLSPNQPGMPQQDVILEKCYRNSRPVLVTAHALGFGIYRKPIGIQSTGLVQIFEHQQLWLDIGYRIVEGNLTDGENVELERSIESSPSFLENHSTIDDLVQFVKFDSTESQTKWVVEEIRKNLEKEELRPDDIIVINPDPYTTREAVGPIRQLLYQDKITTHLAGVDTSPDVFFDESRQSVAFTGIYRAKGNEAGMVYVINAQDCYYSPGNPAGVRNRLFTAITRSKAWVRVLGVGPEMEKLKAEFEKVRKNNFHLKFRYPSSEERKSLRIVNRDMSTAERRRVQKGITRLDELVEDLEKGLLYPEDLGEDLLRRLSAALQKEVE